MPELAGRDCCTGCSACFAACPKRCIVMRRDAEGFLQPSVGDGCVECGSCTRACPLLNEIRGNAADGQLAVAAIAKDQDVWADSSSGGAFTCVCEAFAAMDEDAETVVFGAAMEFPKVVHRACPASDVSPLRRSKYVQSDMGDSFREVRSLLRAGKRVVFSGTPCQVAGLASFLGQRSSSKSLLLIDLICHGVGSPAVFESCMESVSARGGRVVGYSFRNKVPFLGNYERHLSRYEYLDRCLFKKDRYEVVDDYNKLFLSQLCLRRSCAERCPYRMRERFGDVTLADLNGRAHLYPDVEDPRGWSSIVANSEKGNTVVGLLSDCMSVYPSSPDDVARFNPLFERTTPGNPMRDEFFADWIAGASVERLLGTYWQKPPLVDRLARYVPHGARVVIKKIMHRLRML